jgi:pentose-5-phosphate-3-epimerase
MNKYEHLEMMDTPYVPELAIYAQQVNKLTEQSIQIRKLTSLLHDCMEFVPSDLRRKIENAIGA